MLKKTISQPKYFYNFNAVYSKLQTNNHISAEHKAQAIKIWKNQFRRGDMELIKLTIEKLGEVY